MPLHDLPGDDKRWRDARAAGDRLLTVTEAAEKLGLTRSRIHQLLSCGDLRGPDLPSGRLRHVPGAGRVSAASIGELIAARSAQRAGSAGPPSAGARPAGQREWSNLDAVARAAVQEMKVRLDLARKPCASNVSEPDVYSKSPKNSSPCCALRPMPPMTLMILRMATRQH